MSTPLHTQNELMQKRANVVEQARALVNRAKEETRDLNADEQEQYDRMMVDVHSLKEQADREFRLSEIAVVFPAYTDTSAGVRSEQVSPELRARIDEFQNDDQPSPSKQILALLERELDLLGLE